MLARDEAEDLAQTQKDEEDTVVFLAQVNYRPEAQVSGGEGDNIWLKTINEMLDGRSLSGR